MMYYIAVLLSGLLFGCGLAISNMVDANKVLNFLDITGNWDPSLAFVMFSAVIITWIGYKLVLRHPSPILSEKFFLPEKKQLDIPLIGGATLFGIGWGLAGYCPGPAITALGLGLMDAGIFVLGMIGSMIIHYLVFKIFKKQ